MQLLQRGEEAKDYIRHGEKEALIQIKLATGNAKEVVLIERKIITDEERTKGSPIMHLATRTPPTGRKSARFEAASPQGFWRARGL